MNSYSLQTVQVRLVFSEYLLYTSNPCPYRLKSSLIIFTTYSKTVERI